MPIGETRITLTRREEPTTVGDWVYRRAGVKASVYLNQRLFLRDTPAPATITITTEEEVFRRPYNLDPEATARIIATLTDRAEKKRTNAASSLSAADVLASKVAALNDALSRLGS